MLSAESVNPNDLMAILAAGNCLRCGRPFVGGQVVYFVLPPDRTGVMLPVCVRCVRMDVREEYANVMCRYGNAGIHRGIPVLYGRAQQRGWAFLFELADGSWRTLLRGNHLHRFPPQVADDPTFPWFQRDPAGLVYTTDGLHRVLDQASAHAMGVPGVPIVRLVPLDLSQPQTYPEEDDPGLAIDRMEFWMARQVIYYPEPLTPPRMRQEAEALVALITQPGIDWEAMAGWRVLPAHAVPALRDTCLIGCKYLELVLWQNDLWHAAIRGSDAFLDVIPTEEDLPEEPQLWMFAQPYWMTTDLSAEATDALELGGPHLLEGYLVFNSQSPRTRGHILIAGMILSEPAAPGYRRHPILRFFPSADQAHGAVWPLNEIMAACRFMRLPLAGREIHRLPRQQRRALGRAGKPLQDVQVVVLRRQIAPHEVEDREGDIEWSCHWLVKGHWRRQWHPSLSEHRPIYIDAHLKGDMEKPFRPPRQKLYVVAR